MEKRQKIDFAIYAALFLLTGILIIFSIKNPFYWDNIKQISVPANWYYQTDFKYFFLPDNIATGHPTFVGMYFALLWKLFERSLLISHLGMFPFVFGLLLQLYKFLKNIKPDDLKKILLILGFILMDTTFLSQLSLITFDIIQLFFFFLCLNLILKGRNRAFTVNYIFLVLISLRASVMAGGVFIFNILYDHYLLKQKIKPVNYLKYVPGIISLFLFLLLFRINKGWVIHNTISKTWENSGELASLSQMLKNAGIFVWYLIDFGRAGIFIFFLFFIMKTISIREFQDNTLKIVFLVIISQVILFFPIIISSQNPFGHRYLLPVLIPVYILTVYWIDKYVRSSSLWFTIIFIMLFSGHFLLYPLKISQGWDSTTLHWNYFKASEEMYSYITENEIVKTEIGTFFPNKASRYITHLEADTSDSYSGIPFESEYILYSNAFNVSDDVIDSLFSNNSRWELVKKFTENKIFVALYHK